MNTWNSKKKKLITTISQRRKRRIYFNFHLFYGCETWGFENNEIIERIHLKFCKLLLHLKTSTPDYMVYGELGRYPISIK